MGQIINSGADIEVRGHLRAGGLVSTDQGIVRNSFARGSVFARNFAGGLIGSSFNRRIPGRVTGRVTNSYATGDVNAIPSNALAVSWGGLIGNSSTRNDSTVEDSYTISKIIPRSASTFGIGGLRGSVGGILVDSSYWNSDRYTGDDIRPADDGHQRTTMELQSPIDADGIYQQWSTADWDFGDEMNYPMLRYDNGLCNSSTRASGTARCGPLPNQQYQTGLGALFVLSDGEELNPDLNFDNQPFSVLRQNYIMGFSQQPE